MCRRSGGCTALRTIPETHSQSYRERAPSEDTLVERASSEVTLLDRWDMADMNGTSELERKRSYGIGGAGNIRTDMSVDMSANAVLMSVVGSEADLRAKIDQEAEKAEHRKLNCKKVRWR